jgi:hypothetical protein
MKRLLDRSTSRIVPYLILLEAIATVLFYFSDHRYLLVTHWWYFVQGFGSLILLAALEHRQDLPLPFMDRVPYETILVVSLIGFAAIFLSGIVTSLVSPFFRGLSLAFVSNFGVGLSLHAGLSEESFKVGLTNIAVIIIRKTFAKTRSKKIDSAIVVLVGTGAVAVWAWMHAQFAYFSAESTFTVFVSGMALFLLLLLSRNYLPIVGAHILYDFLIALALHQ